MKLYPFFLALAVGCSATSTEDAVARRAATTLNVPQSELRVTSQSDLTGAHHTFQLITRDGVPVLVVVVPEKGDLFDSKTPDAFDRVAKAENAATLLSQLGAERVALWFATLTGKCPMPPGDVAHFAVVEREGGNVRLSYPAGSDKSRGVTRTCVIELAPDGSLHSGRLVEEREPETTARTRSRSTSN
jgi:hypothetical protein